MCCCRDCSGTVHRTVIEQVRASALTMISSPALIAALAGIVTRVKFHTVLNRSNTDPERMLAEVRLRAESSARHRCRPRSAAIPPMMPSWPLPSLLSPPFLANQRNDVDIRRRMDASILLVKALGGDWNVTSPSQFTQCGMPPGAILPLDSNTPLHTRHGPPDRHITVYSKAVFMISTPNI
jgi:hypothetical protein